MCNTTFQLKVCSGKPESVAVPLVWQSLVRPRPSLTCRVIERSLAPLCPGSRKTILPAMGDSAWARAVLDSTAGMLSRTGTLEAYLRTSRRERQRDRLAGPHGVVCTPER